MSEYWKSTPSYWCKHCSIYVRDTPLERRNHEASAKHQNSIQRSLRDLHNRNDREAREKERAKKEVERLNALVGGGAGGSKAAAGGEGKGNLGVKDLGGSKSTRAVPGAPSLTPAQQRKAHAEQLAAMGVRLPAELRKEITGIGGWEVVSERVVEGDDEDAGAGRSMADIVKAEREVKAEGDESVSRGVHKRKAGDEDEDDEMVRNRKKAWGSRLKTYPGDGEGDDNGVDLDSLLSGVTKKEKREIPDVKKEERDDVKEESGDAEARPIPAQSENTDDPSAASLKKEGDSPLKREDSADGIESAPPVVFFKKRKIKK